MVRVRFAPSPTGYLHIGSARTALFNWLYARHTGGKFLLRIEDTDLKRSDSRFLDEILSDLRWLGLDWNEDLLFQSQRFSVYRAKAEELLAAGQAYREGEAIIFRIVPGRIIEVHDLIHGTASFQTETYKDQVLIKSDGSPSYNFACVVDDAHMGITHILRGDDHLSNTPKQILFYEALGLTPPRFGHMPLILGQDGAKLSKRHGGVSVEEYRKEGFLPEALANYLILLGWTPPGENEVLSLGEAVRLFDIPAMNDVQAKFDIQKLRWMNGEYIMKKKTAELLPLVKGQLESRGFDLAGFPEEYIASALDLYKVRIKVLSDFPRAADFFFKDEFDREDEGKKFTGSEENRRNIGLFADRLEKLTCWNRAEIEKACRDLAEAKGWKAAQIIHPTRMAVSGKTKGAGLFEMMEVLGREKTLMRMRSVAHGHTQD
ncbi:MAG TPA: glutamate--tRNA ligase [Candidatus Aminicenantes bacterium]|nr:glutamate--tRNA ligase [Candidatus Aminicenantes bacterium]